MMVQGKFGQMNLQTQLIKDNLSKVQSRIKHQADRHRSEREFIVGDMVYLKLQPYWQTPLSIHNSLKLHSKYYCWYTQREFRLLDRIGKAAYKLLLSKDYLLHLVFHASQLKKHIGAQIIPTPHLPLVDQHGNIKVAPMEILEYRWYQETMSLLCSGWYNG